MRTMGSLHSERSYRVTARVGSETTWCNSLINGLSAETTISQCWLVAKPFSSLLSYNLLPFLPSASNIVHILLFPSLNGRPSVYRPHDYLIDTPPHVLFSLSALISFRASNRFVHQLVIGNREPICKTKKKHSFFLGQFSRLFYLL